MLIEVSNAIVVIYYKQDTICLFCGNKYLFADFFFKDVIRIYYPSTSVNERKFTVAPLAFSVLSVTCGTGMFTNDGSTSSR